MNREDAIWYYRLGGQTLGPVPWAEIEQLTRDTIDADRLLVAQAGDAEWISVTEALEQHLELAPPSEAPAPPSEEAPAPAPVAAAPPPAASVSYEARGAFTPEHGLGKWVGQAWEMVIEDVWPWVGAVLLMMLVSGVTLGIAGPPLTAGLYIMALERYRGKQIAAGDVFKGFSRFLESWGLSLLMMIPALLVMAPMMILIAVPIVQAGGGISEDDLAVGMTALVYLLMPVIYLLVLGVQTIFFYSWVLVADGHGAWESVTGSWEKVGTDFWSYLGTWLILSILASLGSYACYVGLLLTWPLLPCSQVAAYMWHFRRA